MTPTLELVILLGAFLVAATAYIGTWCLALKVSDRRAERRREASSAHAGRSL